MRRITALCVAALTALTLVGGPAPSAGAAEPFCGIRWGSLDKVDDRYSSADITNLRAGRHDCWDRLVVDLGPTMPGLPGPDAVGYQVRYVHDVAPGESPELEPLDGAATLSIVVHARALDDNYNPTYLPADHERAVNVTGFSTFRQVYFYGTYEGSTEIGLGVRARLPFRVFTLTGPGSGSRLVIDVAHRW